MKKILKTIVVLLCMPYLITKTIINGCSDLYDQGLKNL